MIKILMIIITVLIIIMAMIISVVFLVQGTPAPALMIIKFINIAIKSITISLS